MSTAQPAGTPWPRDGFSRRRVAFHTEQYTNNEIEADHGRLKSRLRPMRASTRAHRRRGLARSRVDAEPPPKPPRTRRRRPRRPAHRDGVHRNVCSIAASPRLNLKLGGVDTTRMVGPRPRSGALRPGTRQPEQRSIRLAAVTGRPTSPVAPVHVAARIFAIAEAHQHVTRANGEMQSARTRPWRKS